MHAFVREVKKEGFLLVGLVEPLDGMIGQQIGNVAAVRLLHSLAVDVEHRRIVDSLSLETQPVIESWLRLIVCVTHVPFTHEGGLVSCFLKVLRKEAQVRRKRRIVINYGMCVSILTSQDGGAAGRTKRG